ncbi:Translation elongation factor Ts [hydrothermal vent metagenome]|uniref:Translation elongation factor Ts n=1 Tax=hydrothermal vent metagenome TaxID=652676 RepID=A0A3B0UW78_9ZZZZ
MATISIETVKELRARTGGVSIMQCRKALEEMDGDIEKAEVILRKRAGAVAEKKSTRDLGAGSVASYIHDGTIGALVLLSCETDFVGRNPEFINLAHEIAMQVAATNPTYRTTEEVPAEVRDAAMSVFKEEVKDKPDDMKEKILAGKLASYFKDQVLLEQSYIKDESKSINDLVTEAVQKFGERIEITNYVRYSARD